MCRQHIGHNSNIRYRFIPFQRRFNGFEVFSSGGSSFVSRTSRFELSNSRKCVLRVFLALDVELIAQVFKASLIKRLRLDTLHKSKDLSLERVHLGHSSFRGGGGEVTSTHF